MRTSCWQAEYHNCLLNISNRNSDVRNRPWIPRRCFWKCETENQPECTGLLLWSGSQESLSCLGEGYRGWGEKQGWYPWYFFLLFPGEWGKNGTAAAGAGPGAHPGLLWEATGQRWRCQRTWFALWGRVYQERAGRIKSKQGYFTGKGKQRSQTYEKETERENTWIEELQHLDSVVRVSLYLVQILAGWVLIWSWFWVNKTRAVLSQLGSSLSVAAVQAWGLFWFFFQV